MTVSEMAVPNGIHVPGVENPRVLTRAHARPSVADGDDARAAKRARVDARRPALPVRMLRVVYLDAADSWLLAESAPSIRQVWRTDYAAVAPGGWLPFVVWCKAYRVPAVFVAAALDSIKWLLVHPVRGPLFLTAAGSALAALTI